MRAELETFLESVKHFMATAADLLMRRGLLEDLVGGPVPAALAQDLAGDALPRIARDSGGRYASRPGDLQGSASGR